MGDPLDRTVNLSNWMDPPFNRTAFTRVREVVPTAPIRAGTSPRMLARRPVDLDDVTFDRADGSRVDWQTHLATTWCDAVCVVHRGTIVDERYFNGCDEHTLHLLMSVSKSVCGAALGVAIGRGRLSASDLVCDIAPEFRGTSAEGAAVRHLIDMTAGTGFVEDYDDYSTAGPAASPDGSLAESPLIEYERQAGYRPLGSRIPIGALGHFRTYATDRPHGSWFSYRSPLTNVVARLLEVLEGLRYPDIVARDLWQPLGMEHDADIMLDPLGYPVVEGGMSCSLRDLARLGLAYARAGDGVIPPEWVRDTFDGDDGTALAFRADPAGSDVPPDWSMYRNAFWVLRRHERISGLGIFGQFCWVDLATDTVIARFSTFPTALPLDTSDEVHRAFAAVSASLG